MTEKQDDRLLWHKTRTHDARLIVEPRRSRHHLDWTSSWKRQQVKTHWMSKSLEPSTQTEISLTDRSQPFCRMRSRSWDWLHHGERASLIPRLALATKTIHHHERGFVDLHPYGDTSWRWYLRTVQKQSKETGEVRHFRGKHTQGGSSCDSFSVLNLS